MKNLIYNTIAIILVPVLLISGSGFFIYKHHCNSRGISETAILLESFDCHHDQEDNNDKCIELSKCCTSSNINTLSGKKETRETKSCCNTTKHFYKLKTVFERQTIKNTFVVNSKIIQLYHDLSNTDDNIIENKPDAKPELKIPLLAGKRLIFFLSHQKITPLIF